MAAPDTNIADFQKGEKLTAARLQQIKLLAVEVANWLLASGMIPVDGQSPVTAVPVDTSQSTSTRGGILDGVIYRPPIKAESSGDLATKNLGMTASVASGNTLDAEVWDLSTLQNIRLGHFAGRNSSGKPILIVDSGSGLPPAGEQETVLKAVVDNTWGIGFIKSHK